MVLPHELFRFFWVRVIRTTLLVYYLQLLRKKLLQCLQSRLLSWRETSRLAWSLANLEALSAFEASSARSKPLTDLSPLKRCGLTDLSQCALRSA